MKTVRFFCLILVFALVGCSDEPEFTTGPDLPVNDTLPANVIKLAGNTQGTTYHITFLSDDTVTYQTEIESILTHIDWSLSNWVDGSLIRLINNQEIESITLTDTFDYLAQMYYLSDSVYRVSEGAFDPTVMPLVNAYGFGFKNAEDVTDDVIAGLLPLVGFDKINFTEQKDDNGRYNVTFYKQDPKMQIDYNAIAQGYSVDIVSDFLELNGVSHFMVEIGGELRCMGMSDHNSAWRIQVDQPNEGSNEHEAKAIIAITGKGMATSGNYRKIREVNGKKYSHTIHPKTGMPVEHHLLSATVIAQDCATADAFATVFMVWGTAKTQAMLASGKLPPLEAYLIYEDENGALQTWQSEGMKQYLVEEMP